MTVLPTCPACGFPSNETRCPRCNALKVIGCSGSCSACAVKTAGSCNASDRVAGSGVDSGATIPPTSKEHE